MILLTKNTRANDACVMSCIVGVKKSALKVAKTIVDNSMISIGVNRWLPSNSQKIADTLNVAATIVFAGICEM
jgi:hypothetical protein